MNNTKELHESKLKMLVMKTGYSPEKVKYCYQRFQAEAKNNQIDQNSFVKLCEDLLPNHGNPTEFITLAFKGKRSIK